MPRREPVAERESQRYHNRGPNRPPNRGRPRSSSPRASRDFTKSKKRREYDYEDWEETRRLSPRPHKKERFEDNHRGHLVSRASNGSDSYDDRYRDRSYQEAREPSSYYRKRAANQYPNEERRPRPISENRSREYQEGKKRQKSQIQMLFLFLYNLLFYTITIGVLLMAVLFSLSSKSNASIFGYRFYTVLTNSMSPQKDSQNDGFYSGDIIITKMSDQSQIQPGDIITFAVGDSGRYLTHRLVERLEELNGVKGDYIVTKGDANENNDPPIEASRVLGKVVFSLPKVGSILDFVREEFWLCLLASLSTFGFILVLKAYLFLPPEPTRSRPPLRRSTPY